MPVIPAKAGMTYFHARSLKEPGFRGDDVKIPPPLIVERQPNVIFRERPRAGLGTGHEIELGKLGRRSNGLASGKRCIRVVSHHENRCVFQTRRRQFSE